MPAQPTKEKPTAKANKKPPTRKPEDLTPEPDKAEAVEGGLPWGGHMEAFGPST